MTLLAADMGGTKSSLWLFERENGRRETRDAARLRSSDYPNARSVPAAFLKGRRVQAAAVAIAAPVRDGRAETPNLPWEVEHAALTRVLGTNRVELINDLAATAYGIVDLGPEALATLNEGRPGTGAIAIIAAGTGLGDAAAAHALDIFVRLYGAEAGNLALKFLATGGVYVAGGIAPRILARLRSGPFMEGFLAKGRHSGLLQAIAVKVVLEPKTALFGAARRAEALAAA